MLSSNKLYQALAKQITPAIVEYYAKYNGTSDFVRLRVPYYKKWYTVLNIRADWNKYTEFMHVTEIEVVCEQTNAIYIVYPHGKQFSHYAD